MNLFVEVEAIWGLPSGTLIHDPTSVKDKSQLKNIFYGGIIWDKNNQKQWNERYSSANNLDAILMRSYLGTDALSGALHVWFASKDIATKENYLVYTEGDGQHQIGFSHSGGTQTLYKKIESGAVQVDYAVFASPALLTQEGVDNLVTSGKIKKAVIVQSPKDILNQLKVRLEREHLFVTYDPITGFPIYTKVSPAATVIEAPMNLDWFTKALPYDMSNLLADNNINSSIVPEIKELWIGGASRSEQRLFEDKDFDRDGNSDVITITEGFQDINDPLYSTKVHSKLLEILEKMYQNRKHPFDGTIEKLQKNEYPDSQTSRFDSEITQARDPNIKYGPEGNVLPGQKLDYKVEYENEGEGIAFGVYFTDTLDEDLDDSTLEIGPVISTKDGSVIAPAGAYNPSTRTITWLVGEVGPGEGGYANLSVNVRSNAQPGTEIINFATVYFPSVPETTRTNGIVSTVPNLFPTNPIPVDGVTGVPVTTALSWTEGYGATSYDLYLWKLGEPKPGTPTVSDLVDTTYQPVSALDYETTYQWQVIAKSATGGTEGEIWSFTTLTAYEEWIGNYPDIPPEQRDPEDDPDGDGLTNEDEFVTGTNPTNPDTDGDGFSDGYEVSLGTDPLDPSSKPVGTLAISSTPSGAKIYLDGNYGYLGRYYGNTDATLTDIPAGKRVLRLTLAGYESSYHLVEITSGATTELSVTLAEGVVPQYTTGDTLKNTSGAELYPYSNAVAPFVVDWNMDGKKDILISDDVGEVHYYENSGTDESPQFGTGVTVLSGLGPNIAVFVVDWNNDCKKDLLIGRGAGDVIVYENTGTDSAPVFGSGTGVVNVGNFAIPWTVDWNNDNKKDLLVGDGNGYLNLFLNSGTDLSPAFGASTQVMANGAPLSVGAYAAPCVLDWDADGKKDLLIGCQTGEIYLYLNTGTDESPNFTTGSPIQAGDADLLVGENCIPFVLDWNNDNLKDLVIGNKDGLVYLFLGEPGVKDPLAGLTVVDAYVQKSTANTRFDRITGVFSLDQIIKNISGKTLLAPFIVVVTGISSPDVTIVTVDGETLDGKPYWDYSSLLVNGKLLPGQSVTKRIAFNNPKGVRFTYTTQVFSKVGE